MDYNQANAADAIEQAKKESEIVDPQVTTKPFTVTDSEGNLIQLDDERHDKILTDQAGNRYTYEETPGRGMRVTKI